MPKCSETIDGITIYPELENNLDAIHSWFLRPSNTPSIRVIVFAPDDCLLYQHHTDKVVGCIISTTRHKNEVITHKFATYLPYTGDNVACTTFKHSEPATYLYYNDEYYHLNDIPCVTCGVFSKEVLLCSRCLKRRYCSIRCQSVDWTTSHVTECLCVCRKCGKSQIDGIPMFKCSGCKRAYYCGQQCQTLDWRYHKQTCHVL